MAERKAPSSGVPSPEALMAARGAAVDCVTCSFNAVVRVTGALSKDLASVRSCLPDEATKLDAVLQRYVDAVAPPVLDWISLHRPAGEEPPNLGYRFAMAHETAAYVAERCWNWMRYAILESSDDLDEFRKWLPVVGNFDSGTINTLVEREWAAAEKARIAAEPETQSAPPSGRTEGGGSGVHDEGDSQPDRFAGLREWIVTTLKKAERATMESLIYEPTNATSLTDLAMKLDWQGRGPHDDQAGSLRRRINEKLRDGGQPWTIVRHDNEFRLQFAEQGSQRTNATKRRPASKKKS